MVTGKSRGFALFVYKTQEGATKALLEPYKTFEGQQLHCQLAFDNSHKEKFRAAYMPPQNLEILNQQPMFSSIAAAQNAAMLNQNPAYSMLLVQNPLLTTAASSLGALNHTALAAMNPSASFLAPQGPGYGELELG
ncbi:hypothetical protein HPP92_013357 [Vanilla planifolia]|uniref:RRM domain-containing protein n=1 Tax=Vanilla planifolia TaxID=51239 RepID=A0A835UYK0_VANPL|nr:hypothetical protein HPP92_013357 [Vanilla planifolia]